MKRILRPGRNCLNIQSVRKTGLLIDGRDYYRAFYHAAKRAGRYILISGWQFDSDVQLLRGGDLEDPREDTRFLPFLNALCERNPELEIYILAWDFSIIFMLEREWLQEWVFNWTTNERIRFLFDNGHPIGASQHQKYVVIDGHTAFLGGMDICASRWDDRRHRAYHPSRTDPDNRIYGPYHDVQSYHKGPLAFRLAGMFKERWQRITNTALDLPLFEESRPCDMEDGFPLSTNLAAISRTRAKMLGARDDPKLEIKRLYLDAIGSAEKLIYLENQYFSSYAVHNALVGRMKAPGRPRLQIIFILPKRPQALLEEISIGITQAKLLRSLRETADKTGHALGIYYSAPPQEDGIERPVYIHSKLLLVDDRFLSTGSANTTNRSLGLDVELNVSWEADSPLQKGLIDSIRRVRVALLDEHAGVSRCSDCSSLAGVQGLVERLDSLADLPPYRLHRHKMDTFFDDSEWLKAFKPNDLPFDPEGPYIEEDVYEVLASDKQSLFAEGITLLKKLLLTRSKDPVDSGKASA